MPNEKTPVVTPSQPLPAKKSWAQIGIFFTLLALILLLLPLVYSHFTLIQANRFMVRSMADLQNQITTQQENITALKAKEEDTASLLTKLSSHREEEQTLWQQQMQQMQQTSHSDPWQAAQAHQWVQWAAGYFQFTQDVPATIYLLQNAEQALALSQNPSLAEAKKSIEAHIEALKSAPPVDMAGIFSRLQALENQIIQLPLPERLLPEASQPPDNQPSSLKPTWWQQTVTQLDTVLKKIIIVHRIQDQAVPLLLPEEKQLFFLQIHSQIETTLWSALHHNTDVYQTSLLRLKEQITYYFPHGTPAVDAVISQIDALQKMNVQATTLDFTATLRLLDLNKG